MRMMRPKFLGHFSVFASVAFLVYNESVVGKIQESQIDNQDANLLFDWDLKTQFAKVNSSYKLKCIVKVPALNFWTIDGKVPDGSKFKILTDSNLVIRNITMDDFNREYLCHAIIPGKLNVESMQIQLTSHEIEKARASRINDKDDSLDEGKWPVNVIFGLVGSSKTLTCSARARPYPDFKWLYKNGTIIRDKPDFTISTNLEDLSNLTILLRSADYYGEYICEIWNTLGKTVQKFHLKMPEKPVEVPFVFPKTIGTRKIVLGLNYKKSQNSFTVLLQYKTDKESNWESSNEQSNINPETIEIKSLEPNRTYQIRAAVKSEYHVLGDYSDIILVTTDKDSSVPLFSKPPSGRNLEFDSSAHSGESEVEKVINSKTWTNKWISKRGNKTIITTNSSTVEEIYNT